MQLANLQIKLPVTEPDAVELAAFIPIFHGWIQSQPPGGLLIDVGDYRHIPGGPGVVLVGHHGDYAIEPAGRLGLKYARKTPAGDDQQALREALEAVLSAAHRLEAEPALGGRVRFERTEAEITFNDRLLAPNQPETLQAVRPAIEKLLAHLPGGVEFHHLTQGRPRERFALHLKTGAPLAPPPV